MSNSPQKSQSSSQQPQVLASSSQMSTPVSIRNNHTALKDPYFWLTLFLSLPVVSPLLQAGYHWGAHDARHAVYFLYQFDKAIQDGIWYPRWAPDFAFGYGYPFFNIYGPLPSYAGELFHLMGADYVTAVKIVLGLSVILSGVTMFLFVRSLLGSPAALIAGLSYVYIPYHLFDLYVRAALAESVGFIFVPLVFWGFHRAITQPSLKSIIWGSVAYAGLMFTSNLYAFLLIPLFGIYILLMLFLADPNYPIYSHIRKFKNSSIRSLAHSHIRPFIYALIRRGIPPALVLILGMSLSAIFVLPAVTETQYVRVDQWTDGRYAFGSDFVELFQLFSPHWGFGASIAGPNDDSSFQIGLVPLILFAFSFWRVPHLKSYPLRLTLYFLQGVVVVISFLTLPISRFVWEGLAFIQIAQFPWRLLFILTPAISILAGVIVIPSQEKQENQPEAHEQVQTIKAVLPLALLILLASFPYLTAEIRDPTPTEGPVSQANLFRFQQASDELTGSTIWVAEIPTWSPLADLVISGQPIETRVVNNAIWDETGQTPLLGVHTFEIDSVHEFVWVYSADDTQNVTFYIPYYPGWTATLYQDTAPDKPELFPYQRIGPVIATPEIKTTSPEGWMVIPVPAGNHFLELRFKDTPIRTAGKWISAITLLFMGSALILRKDS